MKKPPKRTPNTVLSQVAIGRWLAVCAALMVAIAGLTTLNLTQAATPSSLTRSKSRLKPASSYKSYKDLRYSGPNSTTRQTLDLYTPNNGVKQAPLIIFVHGGGFVAGSKDKGCVPAEKEFMKQGFAVACINYRYASQARWPAQIVDVKSAVRTLRANAKQYNIYPKKIGVWGESAGGHLVAMAGTSAKVKAFDKGQYLRTSSAVQAVVDDFGPTDLARLTRETKDPGLRTIGVLFGGNMLSSQSGSSPNPITYVNGDEPPFLIRHGDKDPLIPLNHSQQLHNALQAEDRRSQLAVFKGAGHGGEAFTNQGRLKTVAKFFDNYLR